MALPHFTNIDRYNNMWEVPPGWQLKKEIENKMKLRKAKLERLFKKNQNKNMMKMEMI